MSKIRKSAKGEQCTLRIPGYCNFNPETTVLAHIKTHGIGTKCKDIHAVYACSRCHDIIDMRDITEYTLSDLRLFILDAMIETQEKLIEKGLIKI